MCAADLTVAGNLLATKACQVSRNSGIMIVVEDIAAHERARGELRVFALKCALTDAHGSHAAHQDWLSHVHNHAIFTQ